YRSFPSKDLPIRYAIRIGFPVFWAGHPISPPPLVHTLFRAGLCLQTCQILLHRRHPVHPSFWDRMLLRLRYLIVKSQRVYLNHLDCARVGHTKKKKTGEYRSSSYNISLTLSLFYLLEIMDNLSSYAFFPIYVFKFLFHPLAIYGL